MEDVSVPNRGMVTFAVIFGTFISVLDTTIVNVSLRHMRGAFGVDLSTITWVASSYTIAQIITIMMSPWLSTLMGRKRLYLVSFGIFTLGSVLAGTSTTFEEMLFYRVLQGAGGGSLVPISQAILRESYPPRLHGRAMASFGMGVVLAPAFGPVVGGWLTEHYGWPWIFYINVPFAIVGIILVAIYVKDPPYLKRGVRKIDWAGIILLTVGITGAQMILERGQEENWFESTWIATIAVITVVALVGLIIWELYTSEPVFNIRVLRNVPLCIGSGMMLIFGIAQFGTTFILPQFLQDLLGYTPLHAGMIMFPRGAMLFVTLAIVGRLFRFIDRRFFVPVGAGLIIYSMSMFMRLSLDADFWTLLPPLIIMGMGAPFIFITLSTVSLETVPQAEMTAATSIFNLARRLGGNIGFALLTTILERRIAFHRISLISNVDALSDPFLRFKSGVAEALMQRQISPSAAHEKSIALLDSMIDKQATMLAYNDVYMFLGVLFLVMVPMVLFLKGQQKEN